MSERRTQARFNVCLDVCWQASATHRNARVADISERGCYVDTILEVTEGENLSLKIRMPDSEWFEVEGVVTHHWPQLGFGVQFVTLTEEQVRRIQGLIELFTQSDKPQGEAAWNVEGIDISCHDVM